MNNRMYELINQCFIGTYDGKLSDLNTVVNIEKFAELLVRECVKIAYQNDIAKFTRDGYKIGSEIEKHFGVEK